MITDKEHLFNSNMLFCLPCMLCIFMSHWFSSFLPASDPIIISIALFKSRHSHFIILFLRLHMYCYFTVLSFTVSVFWQFSVAEFPTSVLSFSWRCRIFWFCGCQVHHEHNKLQHILIEGILQYLLVSFIVRFKNVVWLFWYENPATWFKGSLTFLHELPPFQKCVLVSYTLYTSFFFFFFHWVNQICVLPLPLQ